PAALAWHAFLPVCCLSFAWVALLFPYCGDIIIGCDTTQFECKHMQTHTHTHTHTHSVTLLVVKAPLADNTAQGSVLVLIMFSGNNPKAEHSRKSTGRQEVNNPTAKQSPRQKYPNTESNRVRSKIRQRVKITGRHSIVCQNILQNVAKHLANLKFRVCAKIQEIVQNSEYI